MLERLEVRTSQLRALSDRVISVQEDERKRIARALHDDTSQAVSTLLIQLERMEDELPANQVAVRRRLVEARGLASAMLDDLRKNIWDLRPTILDDLGLVPAIRWYARMRLQETGVQVSFDMDEDIRPEPYLETLLFRMSQEAVGNILRHAEAKNVIIRLMKDYSRVCLEVEDDGRGFNVEHTVEEAVSHKQLGLLGIHEQASLVGGEAKIDSAPGRGTRVHVCIPLLTGAQMNREGTGPNKVEV
jgi:signal transduction histidine kinase